MGVSLPAAQAEPDVSLGAQNIQPHELLGYFSLPPQQQAAPQHLFFVAVRGEGRGNCFVFFRINSNLGFHSELGSVHVFSR